MCHEGRKLFLTISQWSVGTMSRESKYIISPPCTLIKWKSRMYYGIKQVRLAMVPRPAPNDKKY